MLNYYNFCIFLEHHYVSISGGVESELEGRQLMDHLVQCL